MLRVGPKLDDKYRNIVRQVRQRMQKDYKLVITSPLHSYPLTSQV